jgi:hypothetical protein
MRPTNTSPPPAHARYKAALEAHVSSSSCDTCMYPPPAHARYKAALDVVARSDLDEYARDQGVRGGRDLA